MRRRRSYPSVQTESRGLSQRKVIAILVICLCLAQSSIAATGTVDYNTVYQQLEGFGGAACYEAQSLPGHPNKETIYNLLFTNLGLDVLRIKNTYQINSADVIATGQIVAAGKSRNPALKTELVPWSPPISLKSTGALDSGTLKKDTYGNYMYAEYADWWATSLTGSGGWHSYGVYPDYISIQNEPDWAIQDQVCRFNPTENSSYAGYDKAFEAVYNRMDGNVSPMPKMLAPESIGMGNSQGYINALVNRGQTSRIYGFSHHLYSDGSYSNPDNMISAMQDYNEINGYKPLFMTEYGAEDTPTFEHAVLMARHIHNCLVYEGVTSYYHWSLFRGWGGGGMINIEGGTYDVRELYWFFKHFAYFTDPNWYRINATPSPSTNLRMTAFKDPDGESLTIVILNKSTSSESITLTINDFPQNDSPLFTEIYRSSQMEHWAYIGTFNPSEALTLPAESITTISMINCPASSSWKILDSGMNADVQVATVYNSELIAGGDFTTAGGAAANRIARWDGSSWQPLGSGMDNTVYALTVYNGELIAGGWFNSAGGTAASYIARWDGSNWQPVGSGFYDAVFALTVYNGKLIAGGAFGIAQWNGSNWQPLGSGMNDVVISLTVYDGNLAAGGFFTSAGEVACNYIAEWNGSEWQPLGDGLDNAVYALTASDDGLIAGGEFTSAGGSPANYIARWDGSNWQPMGDGMNSYVYINDLTVYSGNVIAGGSFTTAGGSGANYIARWDGLGWHSLGSGVNNHVSGLTVYEGELIAGGSFTAAGGTSAARVARWGLPVIYKGDLNHDCVVNWLDLKWLVDRWLDEDCISNGWCYEADLNYDFIVNFEDSANLGDNWLQAP
ncbi:MAG: hypothetical protein JXA81_03940 [Sedimentisphaerales bacterium]|nr:hypothetical protein [Sedimentisphaerales bacterium]